jgi:chromate transporter
MVSGHWSFLKDVMFLGAAAFGGPQSHLALFQKRLVAEKQYISFEELMEIHSFCHVLPGPSSTQLLTVVGLRRGGPALAILTLLAWALPGAIVMTILTLSPRFLGSRQLSYLPALVLAYLLTGSLFMLRNMRNGGLYFSIAALALIAVLFFPAPWLFPLGIIVGGMASSLFGNRKFTPNKEQFGPIRWANFGLYLGIFLFIGLLGQLQFLFPNTATFTQPFTLFENTYRMGSLVFGGGNTLVPMALEQYVKHKPRMTNEEFNTGLGLLQAMPGPVFNISVYFNGIAMKNFGYGIPGQLLGCIIGFVGIFLPGLLFVFFVHPIWGRLKRYPIMMRALDGIIAAATGFVVSALVVMVLLLSEKSPQLYTNLIWWLVFAGSSFFLNKSKLPTPVLVILVILVGYLFPPA